MVQVLENLFRRGKESAPPKNQTYDSNYRGISPDQLRSCNFGDENFSGYDFFVRNNGMEYRLSIKTSRKWGTERPYKPYITLSESQAFEEGLSQEEQLVRFVQAFEKLNDLVKEKGKTAWRLNADCRGYNEAIIDVHPKLEGEQPFETKAEAADFSESLEAHGFEHTGWYCAYFSGLTMEQLIASNLPGELWPNEAIDTKKFEHVALVKP